MIGPGRSGASTKIVFDESDESGLNFFRKTLFSGYRTTGLCSRRVSGAVTTTTTYRPCLGSYEGIGCKEVFRTKGRYFCHGCRSDKCVEGQTVFGVAANYDEYKGCKILEIMGAITHSIEVNAPLQAVYNQWTRFEEFPRFMEGVNEVRPDGPNRLFWKAKIGGKEKEWEAEITEQVPNTRIA